jgi:hypothetical protein
MHVPAIWNEPILKRIKREFAYGDQREPLSYLIGANHGITSRETSGPLGTTVPIQSGTLSAKNR